ncbi:siderophore esterase [Penicillium longicatenatum]|nr:siderophore esterase [Penicillium longicatenatum]
MGEPVNNDGQPSPVLLPNSTQFYLDSEQGEKYLIQISWPLHWQKSRMAPFHFISFFWGGIVVAIGYPLQGKLFDIQRRNLDLTPPTDPPNPGYGSADAFLDFIENFVRPAVKARFPQVSVSREALYGHSYGGLFALHALFTRPRSFDFYMASSPSIWWHNLCILEEARAFVERKKAEHGKPPSLIVCWGSYEQNPPQWDNEPLDKYEGRKQSAMDLRMGDNALDLCRMLRGCSQLHVVMQNEYEGEEHMSVMSCSITRGLTMFFEDWPFHKP